MSSWFELVIAIMGGLGLGALFQTFCQERTSKKKFLYEQKITAYTGYLESLNRVLIDDTNKNWQEVVYWTARLELVAPKNLYNSAKEFFDLYPDLTIPMYRRTIVMVMSADLSKTY